MVLRREDRFWGRKMTIGDSARQAWVELLDLDVARSMFSGHPYDFGFVPGMGRLIGAHDGIAPLFGMLFNRIMFEPGALSRAEREMIAAVAAAAQDCHY
jgi:hypothetical protein